MVTLYSGGQPGLATSHINIIKVERIHGDRNGHAQRDHSCEHQQKKYGRGNMSEHGNRTTEARQGARRRVRGAEASAVGVCEMRGPTKDVLQ